MKTQKAILIFMAATVLLIPSVLQADQITFTLTNPVQSGAPGTTLIFSGTLTNPNATTEFINGDSVSAPTPPLNVDDTAFFMNVPISLDPNGSVGPVELFDVMIDPGATPGTTFDLNLFAITGGSTSTSGDILASEQFTVNVVSATTPEPASILLLASGLAMSLLRRRT